MKIKATEKHLVTFYSPGTFFNESSSKAISSWDTKLAVELSKTVEARYGAKPYAFKFYTYLVAEPVTDEHDIEFKVEPKEISKSALHYLGGKLRTYDEVLKGNNKDERILLSNMGGNRMWVIIENSNSYRYTGEFKEEDCIVDKEGNITRKGDDSDLVAYRLQRNKEKDKEEQCQNIH